ASGTSARMIWLPKRSSIPCTIPRREETIAHNIPGVLFRRLHLDVHHRLKASGTSARMIWLPKRSSIPCTIPRREETIAHNIP
ncbi:hypothetical protein CQA89_32640, partial [Klebsiella pneumoniae]